MPKYIDVDSSAYDYGTLVDWLISSVGPEPPVWTEPHIEELLEDFYVVPKSTPLADVVEVRHGRWVNERQEGLSSVSAECSLCGKRTLAYFHYFYCPNCGAKMDEGREPQKEGV